jgi:hypothetical protein
MNSPAALASAAYQQRFMLASENPKIFFWWR